MKGRFPLPGQQRPQLCNVLFRGTAESAWMAGLGAEQTLTWQSIYAAWREQCVEMTALIQAVCGLRDARWTCRDNRLGCLFFCSVAPDQNWFQADEQDKVAVWSTRER